MSVPRVIAIILIFVLFSTGWCLLSGSMFVRTEMLDDSLASEIGAQWGPANVIQSGPYLKASSGSSSTVEAVDGSDIDVTIEHANRYKGLLWFSMFTVDFDATYTVDVGTLGSPSLFVFELPAGLNGYDRLDVQVNGRPADLAQGAILKGRISVTLDRSQKNTVKVSYRTHGRDNWYYVPAEGQVDYSRASSWKGSKPTAAPVKGKIGWLKDFDLKVTNNFENLDYPDGSCLPSKPATIANGKSTATWTFDNALMSQAMGIVMPQRPNAGPIATRMSLFAPVSLLFFFVVLFSITVIKKIPLHPMHYLFISAGFFAFHILLSYLIDKISIHMAFGICSVVSMLLVVSYMRLVVGAKFALFNVGVAQLVYLLGFSYAFFFPGWTGLTIVIGAIVTLFVLMQLTAKIDWAEVFQSRRKQIPMMPPIVTDDIDE
jgi:hypothetical protein